MTCLNDPHYIFTDYDVIMLGDRSGVMVFEVNKPDSGPVISRTVVNADMQFEEHIKDMQEWIKAFDWD